MDLKLLSLICYLTTLIGISSAALLSSCSKPAMKTMLDAMEQLMVQGSTTYDTVYYNELRSCMIALDFDLPASQDGLWGGIIEHWKTSGSSWTASAGFIENNKTTTAHLGMTVDEPCNYASNFAYYHTVTEICNRRVNGPAFNMPIEYLKGLVQAFSGLAGGSSFSHASNTNIGTQQYLGAQSVVTFIIHQIIVSSFAVNDPVVNDLSETAAPNSAIQLAEKFRDLYKTPVDQWEATTTALNIVPWQTYVVGVVASIATIVSPGLEDSIIQPIATALQLDSATISFILNNYTPKMKQLAARKYIDPFVRIDLVIKTQATVMKLVYAFLWQEDFVDALDIAVLLPIINQIGTQSLPAVNSLANSINGISYTDTDFQSGVNVYPGEGWCNDIVPHAKWHLQSAIAMLDLVYLADTVYGVIKSAQSA